MNDRPKHICLIAGEASGDFLGERLMIALRNAAPDITFTGVGGPLMEEQGLRSLFQMERLSVMGIAEVLPRLTEIFRRIDQVADHIEQTKPDVVVTIDAPDFVFRVASKLRKREEKLPRLIHYVAPSVWAWRPERAAKIAKLYDGLLCLLPFEPPYFEREGLASAFIGHPLLETRLGQGIGVAYRHTLQVPDSARMCGLFFGSRRGELKRMGPILWEAAALLASQHGDLHFVAPTLPHLEAEVKALLSGALFPWKVVTPKSAEKPDLFAALDIALAASGTVGLELAIAGVPHVIGYRVNRLSAEIAKRAIRVKYVHLVNILLDAPVVPEFLQEACKAKEMARMGDRLLGNKQLRRDQITAFRTARNMLAGKNADRLPSAQAAKFVLNGRL